MTQLPTTFVGWVELFETGQRVTVPVHQGLLKRRIRGNRWVMALTISALALTGATLGWLVITGSGRTATYVLTGVLAAALAFAILYIRRMRKRLAVAEIDPNYLKLDKRGFVIAGVLDVPWDATVGVVSIDLRSNSQQGRLKLGARLAKAAGATQADFLVGLNKGTAKALKAAADPRLRILVDAFSDCGSIRVPLDAVLRADHVVSVLFAVCGAANVAERESVLAQEPEKARTALNKVMRSVPPISGLSVFEALDAMWATPVGDAAATSEPAAQPAQPDGPSAQADTSTPAPPPPGNPPSVPSEPWRRPTVEDLAGLALSETGRREYRDATTFLRTQGPEAFRERYRDYDDGFSDDGPDPLTLLLAVAVEMYSIGTCEARYEDSPGHVQFQVTLACERLGLPVPSFDGIHHADGKHPVLARLREADDALQRVGLRLLLVDPDSDMYFFCPVTQEQFAVFADASGEGFDLNSVDRL